ADAETGGRPVAQVLARWITDEGVADVAQQKELAKLLVELHPESHVPLAGSEPLVRVGRGCLYLEKRRQRRYQRVDAGIVEGVVASAEHEITKAHVLGALLPAAGGRHTIDDDDVRRRVQIDQTRGHTDVELLAEIPEGYGDVGAACGVRGAEVSLVVGGAELELEVLATLGDLRARTLALSGGDAGEQADRPHQGNRNDDPAHEAPSTFTV